MDPTEDEKTDGAESRSRSTDAAELPQFASSAFEVATRLVRARAAQLYAADRWATELRLVAHRGVDAELLRAFERVPLDSRTPEALAFATGAPQVVGRDDADAGAPRVTGLLRSLGVRQYVAVPVLRDGERLGVLAVAADGIADQTASEIVEIVSALAVALASAQALERERQRRQRLETVRGAALTIAAAPDLETALRTVVEIGRSLAGARFGALGVVDEHDPAGPFRPWISSGMDQDVARAIGRTPRPIGLLGSVARQGRPIRVADVALDPRYRGVPRNHPAVRSFIGVPLLCAGQSVGNLYVGGKVGAPEFNEDDEEALVLLAEHAAPAIRVLGDVHRLTQRASAGERAQRHLAAHYAVDRILTETRSFPEATEHVLRALCEALGWGWGCLWRIDPTDTVLQFAQVWQRPGLLMPSFAQMTRQIKFPRGVGIPGRVWQSGEPMWVADVVDEPRFLRLSLAAKEGMHGAAFFPIRAHDRVVGVIELMNTRIEPPDDELLAMLVGIGTHLGRLLERQRIEEEREGILAELAAERSWLRAVIERSPVAIVFVCESPERLLTNRRAEEILGPMRSIAELNAIGCRLKRTDGQLLELARVPWNRALAGEIFNAEELSYIAEGRPEVGLLASAAPIADASGNRIGAVALFEDISSLRELTKLRDEWTAMVAHDLRQPVTAISVAAGLLARGDTSPESRERATRIVQSASRLNRMISDLLDSSRLDAHRLTLALEAADLSRIVASAVEHASVATEGHAVRIETTRPLPLLWVDPVRIEQVLTNLLSNAAKHGEPGAPIVVEVEARDDEVWISVVNEGHGISREDIGRLFGRFERLDWTRRAGEMGTGLGLHIAKGLVEAHGGRIWAESEPGRTTRFRFALPIPRKKRTGVNEAPPQPAAPPSGADDEAASSREP